MNFNAPQGATSSFHPNHQKSIAFPALNIFHEPAIGLSKTILTMLLVPGPPLVRDVLEDLEQLMDGRLARVRVARVTRLARDA